MSYVAIARKWRPQSFDDIAGQGHVTRTLQNAIKLDRIHHAFLFTGARGVGKTSAARVLSRALNCENGPTPTPCGTCAACKEILAGSSPDVIEIDGASNNSVEDVRELRESVRYLPQRGRSKVYIVDEVHMLSKGAFNALLKTLEEPPDHVVFIFATTEPQKIPDTILSRVQRFDFKRIPEPVVVETLRRICDADGVAVPDAGLRLVARAGEGSMRDAQSLLDRVISFSGEEITVEQVAEVLGLVDRALLYDMLQGILLGEADLCLGAIERVYTYGYDLSEFTAEMLELIRNATLVGLSPTSHRFLDVPDEERTRLQDIAKDTSPDVFVQSFHVMMDVHEQVARAPRPRLVLEMAVARLVSIRPARPVDQIVARLGDLERRLRQGGARAPRPGGRRGRGGDDDSEPAPGRSPVPARPAPADARGGPAPDRSGGQHPAPRPPAAAPPGDHRGTPERPRPADARPVAPPRGGDAQAPSRTPPWRRATGDAPAPRPERAARHDTPKARAAGRPGPDTGPPRPPPRGESPQREARPAPPRPRPPAPRVDVPPDQPPRPPPPEDSWDPSTADMAPVDWEDTPEPPAPPPPIDPEDAGEPTPEAEPAPIAADADLETRAEAFQAWLDLGHSGLQMLARHAVVTAAKPPHLEARMAGQFHAENAPNWTEDPWVVRGLTAYFPGCTRVRASRRLKGSPLLTRQERMNEARRAQIAALRSRLSLDPLVIRLVETLGASMKDVVPDGEKPADLERFQ
jgi:DNA polymerase III subunit gamma/tau